MAANNIKKSNRDINYTCTSCGKTTQKRFLTAKRIEFSTYGRGSKRLKLRTVARLCNSCRSEDPAWNLPAYTESPGFDDLKDKQ